jgi:hypothetical protein
VIARDPLGRVPDERTRSYLDATGGNPFLATRIIDNVARSTARGEPTRLPASSPRRSRADSPDEDATGRCAAPPCHSAKAIATALTNTPAPNATRPSRRSVGADPATVSSVPRTDDRVILMHSALAWAATGTPVQSGLRGTGAEADPTRQAAAGVQGIRRWVR